MRKKSRLVFGVGVNDSELPVYKYKDRILVWQCQFYRAWNNMLKRCYSTELMLRHPTYIGCSVDPEWIYFSAFRSWMQSKDWDGMHLDKDILFPGNKMYSPDTCIFVSPALNIFLIDRGLDRGEWPIGVCWHKNVGGFTANCSNPFTGQRDHLGVFSSPDDAHEAWRRRKHQHALRYADMQTDPRIAEALRTRFAKQPTNGSE
jgi:hypothetical protein